MSRPFTTATLALTLAMAALSPSAAQTSDQAGPTMGMMGGGCPMMGMMGHGMMGNHQARMGAMVDGRLAYLKSELNITGVQIEAWNAYAETAQRRVDVMQGMHIGMVEAMQKGSAIERMDARIKSMQAMVEAMNAVKPAMEKLYAALTAEQKKIADQLIGIDCGAM
jgi:hypothetical protein